MKRVNSLYMIGLLIFCLLTNMIYGQESKIQPLSFENFYHEKMEKFDGILPIYKDSTHVYLEISKDLIGREIEIRAQWNKGFDQVARPIESLGVIYLQKVEQNTVHWQRRIFKERLLDQGSELANAFRSSNIQAMDMLYPVKAYAADRKGYIIDITGSLKESDEWFRISLPRMREQKSSMARIKEVHSFSKGVSFSICRMYGYSPDQMSIRNMMTLVPTGYLPVEIGCVLTLLPSDEMQERFADTRIGYQTLSFLDYTQNLYGTVRDSIIRKWNLQIPEKDKNLYRKGKLVEPLMPIVFYVDTCCPREFFPYIKEGVLAWNKAFEKAGFKNALQVKLADRTIVSVEQVAMIAYDLGEAGVQTSHTFHPKTGEILSCRINIGHGFLPQELTRYFFQCGMADDRIRKDWQAPEVAGEILKSQIMKAVGSTLGLKENDSGSSIFTIAQIKDATWVKQYGYTASIMDVNPYHYAAQVEDRLPVKELFPRIGIYDYQAIEWGYRLFPHHKISTDLSFSPLKTTTPQQDLSSNPLEALKCALENICSLYESFDTIVHQSKKNKGNKTILKMNQVGHELYGEYLLQIASYLGCPENHIPLPAKQQQTALRLLKQYLFSPCNHLFSKLSQENMYNHSPKMTIQQAKQVFQSLFSPEMLQRMVRLEGRYIENIYTVDMYLDHLFSMLFENKDEISYHQMDMQMLCVNVLLRSIEKMKQEDENCAFRIEKALQGLVKRLDILQKHTDQSVRTMSHFLSSRINNR